MLANFAISFHLVMYVYLLYSDTIIDLMKKTMLLFRYKPMMIITWGSIAS